MEQFDFHPIDSLIFDLAYSLYGVLPGLLGQCISVTYPRRKDHVRVETHKPRGIIRPKDWAKSDNKKNNKKKEPCTISDK